MPITQWFELLDQSGATLTPHNTNNIINIINQQWVVKYGTYTMSELWHDFREQFCIYTRFQNLKETQINAQRDEHVSKIKMENQELEKQRRAEAIQDELNNAMEFLKLNNEYKKMKQLQATVEAVPRNQIEEMKSKMCGYESKVMDIGKKIREMEMNIAIKEAEQDTDKMTSLELEFAINRYESLMLAVDSEMSGNDCPHKLYEHCQQFLRLNPEIASLTEDLLKSYETIESIVAEIDFNKSKINFLNLIHSNNKRCANEYLDSMTQVHREQERLVQKLQSDFVALQDQVTNNEEEANKQIELLGYELQISFDSFNELQQNVIKLLHQLGDSEVNVIQMKKNLIINQAKSVEKMKHLQFPPEVTQAFVELFLIIEQCRRSNEAGDKEIIEGYIGPLYAFLKFNDSDCAIVVSVLMTLLHGLSYVIRSM